jgi:flagellar protein FlaG
MNEVRPTQVTPVIPKVASATSSLDSDEVKASPTSGKELPPQPGVVASEEAKKIDIEQAVTEINDYVQTVQRDLHFSVDKDSGLTVIRVRDKESGELIRQIPEDIFLSLAQNLKDNQPIHLFDAHG